MKNILVIGAGRSASSLIKYLLDHSQTEDWQVTVGDVSIDLVEQKTKKHPHARVIVFDITNAAQREKEIQQADLVVSMLPATMHLDVAKDCVRFKKHLATASYVSPEMGELNAAAKEAGITLLNECGLDPGLDHASAMKIIDEIKSKGGKLVSFKSYCGGLVAPESNDNPWGYKFSWNPRNVILAGQSTAQYIEKGKIKFIPYNRLFTQIDTIAIEGHGMFDAYANRDSLSYRKIYGIENIETMLRGTLRNQGYCKAWNVFVKLGITDDTYKIDTTKTNTYKKLVESYLPEGNKTIKEKLFDFMKDEINDNIYSKIEWTGILSDSPYPTVVAALATPAQILQALLEEKWKLKTDDKDMIVMQHLFEYTDEGKQTKTIESSLIVKGEDTTYTAMAKTVGLPLAIAAKLILQHKIKTTGVVLPTIKEIYEPLLTELETMGIEFVEKVY